MDKMINYNGLDYDLLDKIAADFFNKENAILAELHFENYVFAISKGNSHLKRGKVIRVYPKEEFDSMNQNWFLACDFPHLLEWLSLDKEAKKDMYIIGEAKALYDRNSNFRDYIHQLGLEQYFQQKCTTNLADFFFTK